MLWLNERKLILLSFLLIFIILSLAKASAASTSPNFAIAADIFDSGGGRASSPNFVLDDGVAQPMPVGDSASLNFLLVAGKGASILMNIPPVAVADGPDQKIIVCEMVEFNGSGSYDPDGVIISYKWDFGDGTPVGSGVSVNHTYGAAGSYVVTLTVMDDGGSIDTDSVTVDVITAADAIDDLIDIIIGMGLHHGTENSLISKLESAKKSLEKGKPHVAVNKLNAFINKVEAQRGKKLTEEQADLLVAYANRIISVLSGACALAPADLIPTVPLLAQNYPNPFNPDTWIPYQLTEECKVVIRIYAATGQLVRTLSLGHKPAGFYINKERAAYWDGRNEAGEQIASGIYFYNLQAGDLIAVKKMIMRK